MVNDEDVQDEGADDLSEKTAPPHLRKKIAKKTTKKRHVKKKRTAQEPSADTVPREKSVNAEVPPFQAASHAEPNGRVGPRAPTPDSSASLGAAIVQWGPIALLALLVVVFRAGRHETPPTVALPEALSAVSEQRVSGVAVAPFGAVNTGSPSREGSSLTGEKLAETLKANPWALQVLAPPQSPKVSASRKSMTSTGAVGSTVPNFPPFASGLPQGSWGVPDAAAAYWGRPPSGDYPATAGRGPYDSSGNYAPDPSRDPYWWAQQGPSKHFSTARPALPEKN